MQYVQFVQQRSRSDMKKELGVTEARKQFSDVVNQVQYSGDTYVIVKRGKPAAAIVPVEILDKWEDERKALIETIRKIQHANADADPDQVMQDVLQTQQAVRTEAQAS